MAFSSKPPSVPYYRHSIPIHYNTPTSEGYGGDPQPPYPKRQTHRSGAGSTHLIGYTPALS
jgi:hypothetical protein